MKKQRTSHRRSACVEVLIVMKSRKHLVCHYYCDIEFVLWWTKNRNAEKSFFFLSFLNYVSFPLDPLNSNFYSRLIWNLDYWRRSRVIEWLNSLLLSTFLRSVLFFYFASKFCIFFAFHLAIVAAMHPHSRWILHGIIILLVFSTQNWSSHFFRFSSKNNTCVWKKMIIFLLIFPWCKK